MDHTHEEVNHADGQVPKPGDQRHRPSHVVEVAPARAPTLGPHDSGDQTVPGSDWL
jgi:hypothetical protein